MAARKWPRALTESETRARAGFLREQAATLEELRRLDGKIETLRKAGDIRKHKPLMQLVHRRGALALDLAKKQAGALARGLISYRERKVYYEPGFSPAGEVEMRNNTAARGALDRERVVIEYR